jgi:4-hydroxyphenylpyruvate dioxygenase-like putative hemolysin
MKPDVEIYDTTLRDGSQGEGINFSLADKLRIAEKLDIFGVHYIEGGWPGSNPKDMEFFQQAKKRKWKNAKIASFGFTRKAYRGLETGSRDVASHVLEQGEIRMVVTNALGPDHPVARNVLVHGDCVAVIGLRVPDAFRAFREATDLTARAAAGRRLCCSQSPLWARNTSR